LNKANQFGKSSSEMAVGNWKLSETGQDYSVGNSMRQFVFGLNSKVFYVFFEPIFIGQNGLNKIKQ
jgi:hypothetical protein